MEEWNKVARDALDQFPPEFKPEALELRGYEAEYPVIRDEFAKRTNWTENDVRLCALLVYGWMPRIPRLEGTGCVPRPFALSQVADKLSNCGPDGWADEWLKWLNNSLIGTSKFLHFWKPNDFMIFDSNVGRCISASIKTPQQYLTYCKWGRTFVKCGQAPCLRVLERALFYKGRNASH